MTNFLADRLDHYNIKVTGISPYGFGTAETFWQMPEAWEDVTVAVQGVSEMQSGAMLLRENSPAHEFAQNLATYTWVLDGQVPFEMIFTGLKEPVPEEAANATTYSGITTVSADFAAAWMTTRFSSVMGEVELDFVSFTQFNWWPLDTTGMQTPFEQPSLLVQRTMVLVDEESSTPLPEFRELPHNLDDLANPNR
ncbi:hypothetical protein QP027_01165 [Corynebacterium breve]|uniref:DUF4262 domain-containing protein n=1 Tax=Corynebacterium breve TaxID=3049799 RepID=A0ABY8VEG1_9CORY|nr:hypothetical protein [Corynebacterium breve]WIM68041.1 hypothetical protein QP027_01165 [Corynebacterium breve]